MEIPTTADSRARRNSHLFVTLVLYILVTWQVDHTLDELKHQGCHHLDVQGLPVHITAVQPAAGNQTYQA